MRRTVVFACLFAFLLTIGCKENGNDLLNPLNGTDSLVLEVTQPVMRTLVHQPNLYIEGCVTGPAIHNVVYALNGAPERNTIAGDDPCEFHASVPNLVEGVNEVILTTRGKEVTYKAGEETARWDAERTDTLVVYYTKESKEFVVLVDPDTIIIPPNSSPSEWYEVTVKYYADETLDPEGEGPDEIVLSGLPEGLVLSSPEPSCMKGVCTLFLVREGYMMDEARYPVEVEVHLSGHVAKDTLHLTILGDGGRTCAWDSLQLRLDADTVPVPVNGLSAISVYVDRHPGFNGQVEMRLVGSELPPSEVFSYFSFHPNPVLRGQKSSTLGFALQSGMSPGNRWTFIIRAAHPSLVKPDMVCSIPVTFEAVIL